MTIHVNIGEAKTRLSELVAAALRGEEVVLQKAGDPQVRLVPVDPERQRKAIAEKRRAWFGSLKGQMSVEALDYAAEPTFSDEEMEGFGLFPDENRRD